MDAETLQAEEGGSALGFLPKMWNDMAEISHVLHHESSQVRALCKPFADFKPSRARPLLGILHGAEHPSTRTRRTLLSSSLPHPHRFLLAAQSSQGLSESDRLHLSRPQGRVRFHFLFSLQVECGGSPRRGVGAVLQWGLRLWTFLGPCFGVLEGEPGFAPTSSVHEV